MAGKPRSGLRNVVLVWIIGLTLGVGAGALTAMLLLPSDGARVQGESLGDLLRNAK